MVLLYSSFYNQDRFNQGSVTMQSRRDFVRNIITTALLSGSFSTSLLSASSQSMSGYIKPKRLKSGQTIGLIAPSSNFMENESIRFAADILKSFGFRVKKAIKVL